MVIYRVLEKLHLVHLFGNGLLAYIFTAIAVICGSVVFSVCAKWFLNKVETFLKERVHLLLQVYLYTGIISIKNTNLPRYILSQIQISMKFFLLRPMNKSLPCMLAFQGFFFFYSLKKSSLVKIFQSPHRL